MPPLALPTLPPSRPALVPARAHDTDALAPAFAIGIALLWVLFSALVNSAQPGDHFEQFSWAHSAQWGYHKHPPLPTWGLVLAQRLFGDWTGWTYALAALAIAGRGLFTWLIARELLGRRAAGAAVVLWGLHQATMSKAQLYNHDSAMMLCVAACAWLVLRATRPERESNGEGGHGPAAALCWLGAGVAAGAAVLAKYQAAIPLAGIVLAVVLAGGWRHAGTRRGLAGAVVLALAVTAPHLRWLVEHHFVTLHYAESTAGHLGFVERLQRAIAFSVLQLRMLVPALACLGVLALLRRRWPASVPAPNAPIADPPSAATLRRAWLIGLIAFPIACLAVACLVFGADLQDHWGFQTLQFLGIWLAWRLRGLLGASPRRLLVLALITHVVSMAVYAWPAWGTGRSTGLLRQHENLYPAQALADAVMHDWHTVTPCPLRYVVGPTLEAGMVSVYGRPRARVFEYGNLERSPWIDPADVQRAGAVYVAAEPLGEVPGEVMHGRFELPPRGDGRPVDDTYWAIVPPDAACTPGP